MYQDPIQKVEQVMKEIHDSSGKYTQPILKRYPLLFTFLLTFSVAAIIHGFDLVADRIELFDRHPSVLIFIGVLALFLTGTLYKILDKNKE